MKAVILTYAPIENSEKELLKNTIVFKLALNHHSEEYKPNARIISDYILPKICKNFNQKIISIREKFRYETKRVEYPNIEYKGATIVSGVEYLLKNKYDEILIIGDNTVNTKEFQDLVNTEIEKLKPKAQIYQYIKGNFNLPVKSISEFLS